MNDDSPVTPEQADAEDNDPWTSLGSYSDADIAAVRPLLQQGAINFYVGPSEFAGDPTSLTPHHLWVQQFFEALSSEDSPTAYIFRCLHCGQHLGYVDYT